MLISLHRISPRFLFISYHFDIRLRIAQDIKQTIMKAYFRLASKTATCGHKCSLIQKTQWRENAETVCSWTIINQHIDFRKKAHFNSQILAVQPPWRQTSDRGLIMIVRPAQNNFISHSLRRVWKVPDPQITHYTELIWQNGLFGPMFSVKGDWQQLYINRLCRLDCYQCRVEESENVFKRTTLCQVFCLFNYKNLLFNLK